MLHLRRASLSKFVQNGTNGPFSSQAGGRNLVAMQGDMGIMTALDPVMLPSRGKRNAERKGRHTPHPSELLKQLSPLRPADNLNMDAYDKNNIAKMRELEINPAADARSHYENTPSQLDVTSLSIGREIVRRTSDSYVLRRAFWHLFYDCNTTYGVVRVLALAFQRPDTAAQLQHLAHPIVRALYRSRSYATDKRIYTIYYALILRLENAGLRVDPTLYGQCAKFAARSRDLGAMKRALWLFRSRGVEMKSKMFRSIIAKFSIGCHGYGEVRNGKWKQDDLLRVLLGFDGTRIRGGDDPDHHFGSFVKREEWPFVVGWVQILGHCRAVDALWNEWKVWRHDLLHSQHPGTPAGVDLNRRHERQITRFIHYMLIAGDVKKAWMILCESKMEFWRLDIDVRTMLFGDGESLQATTDTFPTRDNVDNAPLKQYAHDQDSIQQKMGVEWSNDTSGGGRRVVSRDTLQTRLSAPGDSDFGRIYGYSSEDRREETSLP